MNFYSIAKIEGAKNSSSMLFYEKQVPKISNNNICYYRLKQVDLDQTFTYSKTIDVSCKNATSEMILFPNPSTDGLFQIINNTNSNKVFVFDTNLKLVLTQDISDEKSRLDISKFADSEYFVVYYENEICKVKKIIKMTR